MDEVEKAGLSRRERQAMDVVYRLGRATAAEIRAVVCDGSSDDLDADRLSSPLSDALFANVSVERPKVE